MQVHAARIKHHMANKWYTDNLLKSCFFKGMGGRQRETNLESTTGSNRDSADFLSAIHWMCFVTKTPTTLASSLFEFWAMSSHEEILLESNLTNPCLDCDFNAPEIGHHPQVRWNDTWNISNHQPDLYVDSLFLTGFPKAGADFYFPFNSKYAPKLSIRYHPACWTPVSGSTPQCILIGRSMLGCWGC